MTATNVSLVDGESQSVEPTVYTSVDGGTDAGITGIGEVTSQSYVCKACFDAPRSASRRHGLTSILLGEDPLDPPRCRPLVPPFRRTVQSASGDHRPDPRRRRFFAGRRTGRVARIPC